VRLSLQGGGKKLAFRKERRGKLDFQGAKKAKARKKSSNGQQKETRKKARPRGQRARLTCRKKAIQGVRGSQIPYVPRGEILRAGDLPKQCLLIFGNLI